MNALSSIYSCDLAKLMRNPAGKGTIVASISYSLSGLRMRLLEQCESDIKLRIIMALEK